MKRSVCNRSQATARSHVEDALSRAEIWGRFRSRWDIYESMLTLAGLFLVADFTSLLRLPVLLEYLFAGILLGGTVGKFVVGWHERGDNVLSAGRVRCIELLWILIGIAAAALAVAVQVALPLL